MIIIARMLYILAVATLSILSVALGQEEIQPKLVCYYTNWAKDRPDPWSYVS